MRIQVARFLGFRSTIVGGSHCGAAAVVPVGDTIPAQTCVEGDAMGWTYAIAWPSKSVGVHTIRGPDTATPSTVVSCGYPWSRVMK